MIFPIFEDEPVSLYSVYYIQMGGCHLLDKSLGVFYKISLIKDGTPQKDMLQQFSRIVGREKTAVKLLVTHAASIETDPFCQDKLHKRLASLIDSNFDAISSLLDKSTICISNPFGFKNDKSWMDWMHLFSTPYKE